MVDSKSERNPNLNIYIGGPRNESIFWTLEEFLFPVDRVPQVQRELDEYMAHYADLTDQRALVLVGALCVEDCLDGFINAFFPLSNILHESRDFTFSLKIDIVQACKLIPSKIVHHCDIIRKLRNDFAHSLDLKTLSDLGVESLNAMDQAIKTYAPNYELNEPANSRFSILVGFVCLALRVYTTHVQKMREFLDSPDFVRVLVDYSRKQTR